jgi:hypothetical protein
MQTKLTLRLDDSLIEHAKQYAEDRGKSLSQVVSDFFRAIPGTPEQSNRRLGPITSRLKGCLKGTNADKNDHREYLEGKYR